VAVEEESWRAVDVLAGPTVTTELGRLVEVQLPAVAVTR
jgi:hypothetical protein